MAKLTNRETSGTSFHDVTITSSIRDLRDALGEPQYLGIEDEDSQDEKVQVEWMCETESAKVFTIYDWKEYRELSERTVIEFHIGGFDKITCQEAKRELLDLMEGNLTVEERELVERVFSFFRENHSYINIEGLSSHTVISYLERDYITYKLFELQMEYLRDYILAQDLCEVTL